MKHSNFAVCGRFRLLVRGEQGDPGISFADKSWHPIPHAIMKSLEPENVDVPFGRSFNVAHAHGYVINTFELHEMLDRIYRIAETIKVERVVLNALASARTGSVIYPIRSKVSSGHRPNENKVSCSVWLSGIAMITQSAIGA